MNQRFYGQEVFTEGEQRLLEEVQLLVARCPSHIDGDYVRCHELARYVGRLRMRESVDRGVAKIVDFKDGTCNGVDHTWLVTESGSILDVYVPGRLPMVQLVDRFVATRIYQPTSEYRDDVRYPVVDAIEEFVRKGTGKPPFWMAEKSFPHFTFMPPMRQCEFCKVHTNAKRRRCCEQGRAADRHGPIHLEDILDYCSIRTDGTERKSRARGIQAAIDECQSICPDFDIITGRSDGGDCIVSWEATKNGKPYQCQAVIERFGQKLSTLEDLFTYARTCLKAVE